MSDQNGVRPEINARVKTEYFKKPDGTVIRRHTMGNTATIVESKVFPGDYPSAKPYPKESS